MGKHLGTYIQQVRKKRKLSLRKASTLAEVSTTMLWEVENGKKEPSLALLLKICKALRCSLRTAIERAIADINGAI